MLSLPIRPLRDRMEIIPIAGYSLEDKLPIAKRLINCRIQSETNLFANYFFTSGIFCPDKGNNMALRKKMSKWMRRWWRSWSKATPKRLESGEDIFWKSQYCNLMFHCFQDPWEATGSIVQGCGGHSGWRGEGERRNQRRGCFWEIEKNYLSGKVRCLKTSSGKLQESAHHWYQICGKGFSFLFGW